jgi:glutamate racemase
LPDRAVLGPPRTKQRSSAVSRDQQSAPIGVFDSGVGGLTVLKKLRRQLSGESTIYLGDEARMPYGPRPAAEVIQFTREAMRWFAKRDCKLIVLACNTATAQALEAVRDDAPVPIIGVVRPGAAAAIASSARRAIGVLATVGTVRSGAYVRAVRDLDPLCDVTQQACPKLVPIVESGKAGTPEALEAVREYVAPLLTEGGVVQPVVDTLLLGCTHYPLLREEFRKVAGPGVRVVDSATTTALAVREVLASHRLLADGAAPRHQVFATGPVERFTEVARTIFGEQLPEVEAATLT